MENQKLRKEGSISPEWENEKGKSSTFRAALTSDMQSRQNSKDPIQGVGVGNTGKQGEKAVKARGIPGAEKEMDSSEIRKSHNQQSGKRPSLRVRRAEKKAALVAGQNDPFTMGRQIRNYKGRD